MRVRLLMISDIKRKHLRPDIQPGLIFGSAPIWLGDLAHSQQNYFNRFLTWTGFALV